MKTENKTIDLTFTHNNEQHVESYNVLRMLDDDGNERTWEMHSFLENMLPPLCFETQEEYMAHVQEWEFFFEFPKWEDIAIPGSGAMLSAVSDHLSPKEIHQWLFDIYLQMWLGIEKYKMAEKVQIDSPSLDLDGLHTPRMTIGILVNTPTPCLSMIYVPEMPDFDPPSVGVGITMNAYMEQGHERIPYHIAVPVVWNITQNKANVFSRGDQCMVRFVCAKKDYLLTDHPERMASWETMPYSQVWDLWK